jgi:hypothetical protein
MSNGTRILVLLTDGRDLGSRSSLSQAIAAAQKANVVVYSIAAGTKADRRPLTALSSATGPQANARLRPASAASRTTVETMCMNSSDVGRRLSKRGASGACEARGADADTFEGEKWLRARARLRSKRIGAVIKTPSFAAHRGSETVRKAAAPSECAFRNRRRRRAVLERLVAMR